MQNKISIVTVILNPIIEDLTETIMSVINQKYINWELIIKDGISNNEWEKNIPNDSRIKIVIQKDNGIYDAMNQGLQYATGIMICLLNSGDYFYDENVLASVNEELLNNPNTVFFYGNVVKPLSRSGYNIYPKKISRLYLYSRMICHQVWFVKKEYYDTADGYIKECKMDADYLFLLKMILKDKINYKKINKLLVVYKGGGISSQELNNEERVRWLLEAKRELYKKTEIFYYELYYNSVLKIKKIIYDRYLYMLLRYIYKKNIK